MADRKQDALDYTASAVGKIEVISKKPALR
jgi:hypothetical protein